MSTRAPAPPADSAKPISHAPAAPSPPKHALSSSASSSSSSGIPSFLAEATRAVAALSAPHASESDGSDDSSYLPLEKRMLYQKAAAQYRSSTLHESEPQLTASPSRHASPPSRLSSDSDSDESMSDGLIPMMQASYDELRSSGARHAVSHSPTSPITPNQIAGGYIDPRLATGIPSGLQTQVMLAAVGEGQPHAKRVVADPDPNEANTAHRHPAAHLRSSGLSVELKQAQLPELMDLSHRRQSIAPPSPSASDASSSASSSSSSPSLSKPYASLDRPRSVSFVLPDDSPRHRLITPPPPRLVDYDDDDAFGLDHAFQRPRPAHAALSTPPPVSSGPGEATTNMSIQVLAQQVAELSASLKLTQAYTQTLGAFTEHLAATQKSHVSLPPLPADLDPEREPGGNPDPERASDHVLAFLAGLPPSPLATLLHALPVATLVFLLPHVKRMPTPQLAHAVASAIAAKCMSGQLG
ncbi:uncharacterized protein AMSG_01632 [Thecamonas trahens ATCC 50062]|uniref:Uncharacterized protein n=1 Tax=Thecamonas trahens ATCC 50062 TaxID=461836 RepID=A0A0L0DR75_THETB|nr:hypothetical protein AMSG_01632 [Thecamonas trahens ATCC 50062]KNC54780.1 hypothetical protein AMSG_01632 [Thecamonas trahens ATCC 50062]|eukprot:XP_013761680.1 hypothetical protein AMSG_01632 [Thecamonas trahens ATCC 50062]